MDNENQYSGSVEGEGPKEKQKKGFFTKKKIGICFAIVLICVAIGLMIAYLPPESKEEPDKPEPEPEIGLRLPETLKPLHYVLHIQGFLHGNFSIVGHVNITFKVEQPTSKVIFHILDIVINNETIMLVPMDNNPNGEKLKFTSHAYDAEKQLYISTLDSELKVNETYTLSIDYLGYLNDMLAGFYRSVYDKNGTETLIASTHFEATDARRAFPCFDEPALKATFDISVAREEGMGAISNMPNISTEPIEDQPGWYWEHFNTTLPMSTYLVAFVVSDFTFNSSNENDHVEFRVWAREAALYQADYALDIGPEVLTFYEDYFSIPFPLPKQDMVAIPDFSAGAMENWGLIIYRETALLYDPILSGASNKQRVASVVAHELAHQWFGDLVSPAWWSELWLNEGFASFMTYGALDDVEPSFKMNEQFLTEELQPVLLQDSYESSHPISVEVENPDEISEIFDDISYNKGASILRMMQHYLTESTFKLGLTNYLNELKYSSAVQDDLWASLTTQAHSDGTLDENLSVKEIMDTWTLQMGYPVVTVIRKDNETAHITQERFLLAKNEGTEDEHEYMWWIPLNCVTQESSDFSNTSVIEWMNNTEKEKTLSGIPPKDQWVIFNIQETGFYRVNYDVDNWEAISNQLKNKLTVIHLLNRAQIIDDSLNLARGGLLHYNITLDINTYLTEETEYVPWKSAMTNLHYLEEMLTRTSGYGSLKDYLLSLSTPLYESLGFEDNGKDNHVNQLKRAEILSWMCNLQYEDCLSNSIELYGQWMKKPNDVSIISPNLKSTVFCYGIAEGDLTEWDFAWEQYLISNLGTDKDKLMSAMGCSKIPWILERYLELTFTEGSAIRMQDASRVFTAVASNDYGRDIAWSYLKTQWNNLVTYYGSAANVADFTYTVSSSFNTEEDLKELLQLKEDHYEELGTATQAFDQAIENVKNNIEWMNNYYTVINSWLIENGYGDFISLGSL